LYPFKKPDNIDRFANIKDYTNWVGERLDKVINLIIDLIIIDFIIINLIAVDIAN